MRTNFPASMDSLAAGALLVAEPPMADPNFKRSVILLCEHSVEGSFGLVLNKPSPMQLSEVSGLKLPAGLQLGMGGPVQPDTLHFLHPFGDEIEGALPIAEGVWWGGNLESLLQGVENERIDALRVRFFLGYSGWGEDQLEEEVEEGGWIVLSATESLVFAEEDDELWRQILRELGGEYALLSTFPDNPRFN